MDQQPVEVGHIASFLRTLFEPTDMIEFRWLPDRRQRWCRANDGLEAMIGDMLKLSVSGQHVYFGANPRKGGGGKTEDVALARCLFCDWDNMTQQEVEAKWKDAGLPDPTALVASGRGYHAYWKLIEPASDLKIWTAHQRGLIAMVGSDQAIHDPPRIMRLPWTTNHKNGATASVVAIYPDRVFSIDALGISPVFVAEPTATGPSGTGDRSKLKAKTKDFLVNGAREGERNNRLFDALTDMLGIGLDESEIEADAWRGAQRCVPPIERGEFNSTWSSARGKPRTAYVNEGDEDFNHWATGPAPESATEGARDGAPARTRPATVLISNVVKNGLDDDGNPVEIIKPIEQIVSDIKEATDGWPRRVSGLLFSLGIYRPDQVPSGDAVRVLKDHQALFAWLREDQRHVSFPPLGRKGARIGRNKETASPCTRQELFEHLKATAKPNYRAVELLPHIPDVDGVYYIPFTLPASNGDCLKEFVNRLNADEPEDRILMAAALMTPGWGGPPGSRPAFLFTSRYGRGSGKTKTVEVICEIWGGRMTISPDKEDWKEAKSRLLSDSALSGRCVLIDNVRHRLQGSDLESLITSPIIDGKRMYVGQFSRPNTLTYFITANTPRLSQDLADRSIPICVGQPRRESDFEAWAWKFIADNRLALLADLYAAIRADDRCAISPENRDRWSLWQSSILTKFKSGDAAAAKLRARRPATDVDRDDAEEIRGAIEAELTSRGHNIAAETVQIPRQDMLAILRKHELIERNMNKRGATTWLSNLLGAGGPLARLIDNPSRKTATRTWLYVSEYGRDEASTVDLRPDNSTQTNTWGTQGTHRGRNNE